MGTVRAATGAAVAGIALLLLAACGSSGGSSPAATATTASAPASSPASSTTTPAAGDTMISASPATTASATSTATATATASPESSSGADVFLAASQLLSEPLHAPACTSGCALSGDATAILKKMTWTTWSSTEAVGTGTYDLDGCNPNCAAGTVYPVPVTVTFSLPVKACTSSGTRYFWSKASFRFPDGLPKALQGSNGPQNPWTFSAVSSAAEQSCSA